MAQQQFNPTPGVSTNEDCEAVINANATDAEGRLSAIEAVIPQSVTYTLSDPAGIELVSFTDLFGPMVPLAAVSGATARQCLVLWTFVGYNTTASAPNPGDFVDTSLSCALISDGGNAYGFGKRFVKGPGRSGVTSVNGFDVITINPGESFSFVAASLPMENAAGIDVLEAVANWGPFVDGTKITFLLL